MATSQQGTKISRSEREKGKPSEKDECWKYIPLYRAALQSDWKIAEEFFKADEGAHKAIITNFSQTALHIAVAARTSSKAVEFVKRLVDKMSCKEVEARDKNKATALHSAAWAGNIEAAKILVQKNQRLLFMQDFRRFLPVHGAALSAHKDTVSCLLDAMRDATKNNPDPNLFLDEESAAMFLISVIRSGFYDIALELVRDHPELATSKRWNNHCGLKEIARKASAFRSGSHYNVWQRIIYTYVPVKLEDRTVCHHRSDIETAVNNSQVIPQKYNWAQRLVAYFSSSVPCIKHIRKQKQTHLQALQLVKCLCERIISLNDSDAYELLAKDAILTAARLGIHEVIEEIVESFPSLFWVRDKENHSLLQQAVIERHENVFNLLYQMDGYKHAVIQIKDDSNNNLLHLAGRLAPPNKLSLIPGAALQMQRELQWFQEVKKFAKPNDIEWRNRANETPKMVFTTAHKDLVIEAEKWMKDTAESCTIPATLIAAMVFAAAITVPGGNDGTIGLPIFLKEFAFSIFIFSDAISLFSSTTSLLIFLSILTSRCAEDDFLFSLPNRLIIGLVALFLSITSMVVAFSSALYLVLGHHKAWILFLVAAILGCLPIISFAALQFPLRVELIASTYGPGIFGKQSDRPFH